MVSDAITGCAGTLVTGEAGDPLESTTANRWLAELSAEPMRRPHQMAYLCYLEPGSFTNPHYLVRRLRRKLPKATIVDGFWTLKADEADQRNALAKTGADLIATFLHQAVAQGAAAAREAAHLQLGTEFRSSGPEPLSVAS
jgi:hypothetical protein